MGKRRRGRKRKMLPRTASGRLSRSAERRDIETTQQEREAQTSMAELHAARARAFGLSVAQASDPHSETIAGRMFLNGKLTRSQAEALDEFGKLIILALSEMQSPASPRCSLDLARTGGRDDDPQRYASILRRYHDAVTVVQGLGWRVSLAVNVVVRDMAEPAHVDVVLLRRGADALVRHFGFDRAIEAA